MAAFDRDGVHTSVTPAWRAAALHVTVGAGWALNTPAPNVSSWFTTVSNTTAILRAAFPNSGAYLAESDYWEPEWEASFWGAGNYPDLQVVKALYDPNNVFNCHHCVELPTPRTNGARAVRLGLGGGGAVALLLALALALALWHGMGGMA